MPRIKLITFDLDNTLWNVDTVIVAAEQRMRAWLHDRVPEYAGTFPADAIAALRDVVVAQSPELRHDLSRLRQEVLYRAIVRCGRSEADARQLARDAFGIFLDARHEVAFFEGALETLERLSRDYLLGALTNGNADIARLKLDRYFGFGYSAASVGAGKPAPQIFRAALDHAGADAGEAVHIGDHLVDDVHGASNVGMQTIWVNPEGQPLPDDATAPTRIVTSIGDVPERIDELIR
jgi:FMN hydrolase / 5-amino-6-(5-phospho-D-ribitylamino)uracil phosphatase